MIPSKPIFNSFIAKQLIKMGNKVIDLQPDKKNKNGVVIYFEVTDKFEKDLDLLSHNK